MEDRSIDWVARKEPVQDQRLTSAMQRFTHAMKQLRVSVGSDFTTQQCMILVSLWMNPGQSQTELAKCLEFKISAASRHCRSLSEFTRPVGEDGYVVKGQHLIIGARDPRKANTMRYQLSEETRQLMDQFAADLAGVV